MKHANAILKLLMMACLTAACQRSEPPKTVICIPVYGQSLALGEEALLQTHLDSLGQQYGGRIVTERMDHGFGYFDTNTTKQRIKQLLHINNRSFELSLYAMAQTLAAQLGPDTLICIFPGGQGGVDIAHLNQGTPPFERFLTDLSTATEEAHKRGWTLVVPAICWMQGETNITRYLGKDYKALFTQCRQDMDSGVRRITGQREAVRFICYQTNALSLAEHYAPQDTLCPELQVAQAQMELVRDDSLFWASGPTYPYSFVSETIHLDGGSQQRIGRLAALSALDIIRHQSPKRTGLVPVKAISREEQRVAISMQVPYPPLRWDTTAVSKVKNYGFSVITSSGEDIAQSAELTDDEVIIACSQPVTGCKVRYGVNGEIMKSGWLHGPRGNLRDSQGEHFPAYIIGGQPYPLHNWCYQFELPISPCSSTTPL